VTVLATKISCRSRRVSSSGSYALAGRTKCVFQAHLTYISQVASQLQGTPLTPRGQSKECRFSRLSVEGLVPSITVVCHYAADTLT